jgi:hypothetical protein
MSTSKTPLQYFKEIEDVSRAQFAMPVPPQNSIHERDTYRTGDGDYVQPLRPGSQDYKLCRSRGLLASMSS